MRADSLTFTFKDAVFLKYIKKRKVNNIKYLDLKTKPQLFRLGMAVTD